MSTLSASPSRDSANTTAPYIDMRELARLLDVPDSTAYTLNRQGRIPGVVKFGRHIRFNRAKVLDWLEQGGEKAAA